MHTAYVAGLIPAAAGQMYEKVGMGNPGDLLMDWHLVPCWIIYSNVQNAGGIF
jgi:hypothetical protein